ncbi:MAG: type II toxin-antitoxin system HicB family antitoxin [Candidatus Latescibacteria bacterium]|jgi:predicted RNase H-like HicB family nuclease|nr:type II toxin-antitoxin system HicB family antitoxin [Candidatus Latescibacterota bacterium]
MKSYVFKVVLEKDKWPDEPESSAHWGAHVPALPAAVHGYGETEQETLENLPNVVDMVVEAIIEQGEPIPTESEKEVHTTKEPVLAVTV